MSFGRNRASGVNLKFMPCPIGKRLTDDLAQKVQQMVQSDANMKNPKITLRIRGEDWKSATLKVAEARARLQQHQSDCAICSAQD
jgi:hypothetical protein